MPELPLLPIGSLIEDRYEVLSELGLGSSGRVYKARQISTGQRVAIKVLRLAAEEDAPGDTARRRFEREMQLCAELSHPNIVRLLDSGRLPQGELFVVFEFVPGMTLDQLLSEVGALGFRETLHLMAQILDALGCAHRRGIVHRDLKPANIILSDTGARRNALVLDFGLGGFQDPAAQRASQALTRIGEFMGTPLYAAPEQLRGEPATARSDLYSWSLVLLECLLGRHVLEGSPRAGVVRFASSEPLPLPDWLRRHRLARLLEVYTSPDPQDRDISLEAALRTLELAGWEGPYEARASEGRPTSGEWRMLMIASCRVCLIGSEPGGIETERRDTRLRRELEACTEIAARHGGRVASMAGDRVLFQFGHPRAAEDDARRAARAMRAIADAAAARTTTAGTDRGPVLEVHIGLHAGPVLTRDLPAEEGGAIDAVGTTFATAIDLDELAGPGEVLLSPEMRDALRDSSSVEIAPDRVLAARPSDSIHRLRAHRDGAASEGAGETLLVARDHELHELRSAWERACSGAPTCFVVSGEVGLGKSRLVRELRRTSQEAAWIEGRCLPEHRDSPLRPIIELIAALGEPVEELVERCGLDARPNVALLRSLLGLPPHPDESIGSMSRERQSDLTLAALVSLVTGMAQAKPAVFVVEDLHWADPTTLEFLTRLVREVQAAQLFEAERPLRLLVVLTARTEFVTPWSEATPIVLRRLSRADVHKMIESGLRGDSPLPAALLEQIIQGADGTPLFVEEVTRMLLAARSPKSRPGKDPGAPIEIPTSLTSLLVARLDALSPDAKETAQVASVLGREFEYSLLEKVAPKDSTTLRHDLEELVHSTLLLSRGRSLERYVFKHALIRDAAYQSMIESVRCEWHRRTAAVLLRDHAEWSEQRPEVIAWHFEGAREPANAADYRRRSADRALVHVAYLEAIRHAEQGLELLEQVAPSRERTELCLRLTESLGSARFSTSGYSVPDVRNAFERALALCGELGGEIPIRVLWGLWMFQSTTGQDSGASEVIGHLRRRAQALGDPVSLLASHTAIGALAYYHGEFERALAESRSALDYYSTVEFQTFVRDYGYDIGIYAFAHLTMALLALGYWAESSRVCTHMLAAAERWENPYIMAMARAHAMNMVRAFGDVDATSELADQLFAQAQEQKLDLWIGPAISVRGWVIARRGDPVAGIAEMKRGLEQTERTGFLVSRGFFLGHLAEAQLAQGDVDAAIASLDRALELCRSSLDRFHEPALLTLRGECLKAHGDTAAAEAHFRRSLELGRKQRSKSYERLAAQSLARLLDERGDKEAAAELLRPIVAWFRAGHKVPGLFDAEVFRESPRPSVR